MSSDPEQTYSICPYCGVGCGLGVMELDGDVRLARWADAPVNDGALCIKGGAAPQIINDEDRLTSPLIREDGAFRKASWDEALGVVADELGSLRETYGPASVAFFASSQVTNEENYVFQKLVRQFGTNSVDNCARLCHSSTVAALKASLGMGAMTNSLRDLRDDADVYWMQGSNPAENHVIAHSKFFKQAVQEGTALIQVDPRENETTEEASLHLQPEPGTDVALLNVVLATIIENGWYDEDFIAERTDGFEDLVDALDGFDKEAAAETCGVPLVDIEEAAEVYATAENAAIFTGMGMSQHTSGTDNVQALINLALLTGNLGRPGTGVNPLRGQNNVQGAGDVGALPNVLPGYQPVDDPDARAAVADVWGFEPPSEPGLTSVEVVHAAGDDIQGLYVMGENPAMSDPNLDRAIEHMQDLEFMVVQDIFMTETAELADVVLPATSWAERDGTVTNTDRRVQRMRAATQFPGDTKHDYEIICEIGQRLFGESEEQRSSTDQAAAPGSDWEYEDPEAIFKELRAVAPIYAGITYDRIGYEGVQWPCYDEDDPGTEYVYADEFATENGRGKFRHVDYRPAAESADGEYPLVLTTGRIEQHYNSGAMSTRSDTLSRVVPENFVEINPVDAAARGIEDEDRVVVRSRRGEIELKATVTNGIKEGVIFSTPHFPDAPINKLTNDALDPVSKIPEYKVSGGDLSVDIEPVE